MRSAESRRRRPLSKTKTLWCCNECGHSQTKWTGSCSMCQKWNTFVEEVEIESKGRRFESASEKGAQPMRVGEIKNVSFKRILTGFGEFDRLMGGGVVTGSLTLVGGDPGIGKSTLMLQISQCLASQGLTVLYICGEESVEQTSMRAQRLSITSDNLYLLSETNFSISSIRSINSSPMCLSSTQSKSSISQISLLRRAVSLKCGSWQPNSCICPKGWAFRHF